jgi:hypothetical protein
MQARIFCWLMTNNSVGNSGDMLLLTLPPVLFVLYYTTQTNIITTVFSLYFSTNTEWQMQVRIFCWLMTNNTVGNSGEMLQLTLPLLIVLYYTTQNGIKETQKGTVAQRSQVRWLL